MLKEFYFVLSKKKYFLGIICINPSFGVLSLLKKEGSYSLVVFHLKNLSYRFQLVSILLFLSPGINLTCLVY